MKRCLGPIVALALAACSSSSPGPAENGFLVATVGTTRVTSATQITRVSITVQPANVTVDLTKDAQTGNFVGTLTVPPGTVSVTASAYSGTAPNWNLVGTGSANGINVASNQTTPITINILDTTGTPPPPDHGPYVTSIAASTTSPVHGDTVNLTSTAVDPDGDTVTYHWTDSCGGTFGTPDLAATTWTYGAVADCTVTVTATSRSLTDSASVLIHVLNPTQIQVTATYLPQPVVTNLTIASQSTTLCTINRTATDASCRTPIPAGTITTVTLAANDADPTTYAVTTTCGLAVAGAPSGTFTWQAPATSAVCEISATATKTTLSDTFVIAVLVKN